MKGMAARGRRKGCSWQGCHNPLQLGERRRQLIQERCQAATQHTPRPSAPNPRAASSPRPYSRSPTPGQPARNAKRRRQGGGYNPIPRAASLVQLQGRQPHPQHQRPTSEQAATLPQPHQLPQARQLPQLPLRRQARHQRQTMTMGPGHQNL